MVAVFSPLSEADLKSISKSFALGEIVQATPVAAGSVNSIYRLQVKSGIFYLRLDEIKDPKEIERELVLTVTLAKKGFPTPAPLALPDKSYLLPWKGKGISLFPEVKGEPIEAADLQPQHLHEIGRMLAHLHQCTAGYPETLQDRFGLPQIEDFFAQARPQLAKDLQPYIEGVDQELNTQKKNTSKRQNLPQGVVHGDVFADNLFFVADHLNALIDFDAAASRELLYDLTTAMNALCWNSGNFSWPHITALMQGYESKRKLNAEERQQIIENWRLSSLRFTVTRIKDFHLRAAGKSGLIHRDFRDFYARLEFQQKLSADEFWGKLKS